MPKIAKPLSPTAVAKITTTTAVGGVAGLLLQVRGPSRSWVLRTVSNGKRRELGVGSYPEVSVYQARERAGALKDALAAGRDPLAERRKAREALTFKKAAADYITSHRAGWKNSKHADQWETTLRIYAEPSLGAVRVQDITTADVVAILKPIWQSKRETASRLRGRIELVIAYADKIEARERLNPARWRSHLDTILTTRRKPRKHHAAVPVVQAGAFYAALQKVAGVAAQALRFAILTAARSGEVRMATWEEIDLKAKLWAIPSERMKAGREHVVPLSSEAVKLLKSLPHREGWLFPGRKSGKPLSDMSLLAVMRDMKVDATPHGFRSTFRDWAGDHTAYPREVIEQALAHAVGDAVEAAYRRGTAIEKRRALMSEWAAFLGVE